MRVTSIQEALDEGYTHAAMLSLFTVLGYTWKVRVYLAFADMNAEITPVYQCLNPVIRLHSWLLARKARRSVEPVIPEINIVGPLPTMND